VEVFFFDDNTHLRCAPNALQEAQPLLDSISEYYPAYLGPDFFSAGLRI